MKVHPIKRIFCLEELMWVLNNLQKHIQTTQSTEGDPIKSFIQSRLPERIYHPTPSLCYRNEPHVKDMTCKGAKTSKLSKWVFLNLNKGTNFINQTVKKTFFLWLNCVLNNQPIKNKRESEKGYAKRSESWVCEEIGSVMFCYQGGEDEG